MAELALSRFSVDYENNTGGSYLLLGVDRDGAVREYQVEMIANNSFPGVLKLDLRYRNNRNYLYYNITSMIDLAKYLSRKKLNKNEFIAIIQGIAKVLIEAKNYFLYDSNFVLSKDYIYINPSNCEVRLIYLPLDVHGNAVEEYRNLVKDMILNSAQIDENDNSGFLNKILNYFKSETFNVVDFEKMLNELNGPSKVLYNAQNTNNSIEIQKARYAEAELKSKVMTPNEEGKEANNIPGPQSINIPGKGAVPAKSKLAFEEKIHKQSQNVSTQEKVVRMQYKTSSIMIAAMSQVVLIGSVLALVLTGSLKSISDDIVSSLAGIGIAVVGIDFLLFRRLFDKNKMIEKVAANPRPPRKNNVPVPVMDLSKREIRSTGKSISQQESSNSSGRDQQVATKGNADYGVNNEDNTAFLGNADGNSTVVLGYSPSKNAYLQSIGGGVMEKITISKPNFIIGRLTPQVDYVSQNGAVGKIHAEIITRDGAYFLKDYNSRNGTFINGNRIDSNKEYEIRNNDRITFANSEYTFVVV